MTERRIYLAERTLVDFFLANPQEELTAEDAAAKLGVNETYSGKLLSTLAGLEVLERVSVYRLKRHAPSPDPAPPEKSSIDVRGLRTADAPSDSRRSAEPVAPPSRLRLLTPETLPLRHPTKERVS